MVSYVIVNVQPTVKSDLRADTYLTLIPRPAMGILTFTVTPRCALCLINHFFDLFS